MPLPKPHIWPLPSPIYDPFPSPIYDAYPSPIYDPYTSTIYDPYTSPIYDPYPSHLEYLPTQAPYHDPPTMVPPTMAPPIMPMWLYSRSTTVIHHDSPWLIRHDTLSVRVRQYSGIRSGSGM